MFVIKCVNIWFKLFHHLQVYDVASTKIMYHLYQLPNANAIYYNDCTATQFI